MCAPSLPNHRERTPLGELSGNIQVPHRPPEFGETHSCKTPTSSMKLCNNIAEDQCADTHDINTEASLLKNPLGSESRQQQSRTQDSVVTLQDDICEVFDSQLLRELDDFCNKQPKKTSNAYQELSDSPFRIASRLDTTDSFSPSRDWVSLQKDVLKTESLGLSTTKTSGEQPAKQSTAVSHVTNAFPCRLPIECVASSMTEKIISAEQATLSEDAECLHLHSATTTEPISAAYPATEPNPSRANSGCSDVTVTQPLIAPSTSNRGACDTDLPEHLRKLNESQREAALSDTFKPLLILAGPGSGKVHLLSHWASRWIHVHVVRVILGWTFFFVCLLIFMVYKLLTCFRLALQTSTMVARLLTLLKEVRRNVRDGSTHWCCKSWAYASVCHLLKCLT